MDNEKLRGIENKNPHIGQVSVCLVAQAPDPVLLPLGNVRYAPNSMEKQESKNKKT